MGHLTAKGYHTPVNFVKSTHLPVKNKKDNNSEVVLRKDEKDIGLWFKRGPNRTETGQGKCYNTVSLPFR